MFPSVSTTFPHRIDDGFGAAPIDSAKELSRKYWRRSRNSVSWL